MLLADGEFMGESSKDTHKCHSFMFYSFLFQIIVAQWNSKAHKEAQKAQWQNWQSGRCGAEIKFPYIHNSQPD